MRHVDNVASMYCLQDSMQAEAADLAKASFGATMLLAIGRVYSLQGEMGGSNLLNGFLAGMQQRSQSIKTQAKAALLAVKVGCDHALDLPMCRAASSEWAAVQLCCCTWTSSC